MSRHTYVFVGSPGEADAVMRVIEGALGGSFATEPGSDPYLRLDPLAIYVGGHEFDDDDVDFPDGSPVLGAVWTPEEGTQEFDPSRFPDG